MDFQPITIYFKISAEGTLWRQSTHTEKRQTCATCRVCLGSVVVAVVVFLLYVHAISLIGEITYVAHTAKFLCYHE